MNEPGISPPLTFSDRGSPRFSDTGTPRFTEHFNASPPYQQYLDNGENAPIPTYESQEDPIYQRLSNKGRPMSPHAEYISPIPEAYHNGEDEKEVVFNTADSAGLQIRPTEEEERPRRRRVCGMPLLWLSLLIVFVVILIIGLGVGLGVGMTMSNSSNNSAAASPMDTQYMIGGSIDPTYFSTDGAFNGSGIALASQSFATTLTAGTQGSIVMYFQHWTGEIRYKQLNSTGTWGGGDVSTVVADDAKNGTALSAVAYNYNQISTWHVFYIDKNNMLKQRSNSNLTNIWVNGTINALNVHVFDADMVGMQACWYGNDYGDADYAHTPLPNQGANASQAHEVGMHMWYAKDNTTFQQLGWRAGTDGWTTQQTFNNMNGHAGVGCYSWGPGTVTYVMFVNLENTVEFWWKDTNTNITSTNAHPINQWVKSSIGINNVYPASSLGYTNAFYAQDNTTLLFNGYNISWAAENTSFVTTNGFTVGGKPGLPGTHLSVTAIPAASGGDQLYVFYQTNGSDISEYTRDFVAGQWSSVDIPIQQP